MAGLLQRLAELAIPARRIKVSLLSAGRSRAGARGLYACSRDRI
jgi:hypothetical protein